MVIYRVRFGNLTNQYVGTLREAHEIRKKAERDCAEFDRNRAADKFYYWTPFEVIYISRFRIPSPVLKKDVITILSHQEPGATGTSLDPRLPYPMEEVWSRYGGEEPHDE